MNRLDEIKARVADTGAKLNEYEPSPFTIDTARDLLMLDIPALVAAAEAVLNIPLKLTRDMDSTNYNRGLTAAKQAIRNALGEDE